MIFGCYENRIDIVVVETISRFAGNTVDLLETVSRLKSLGVEIIFHQENLRTSETDNDILISVLCFLFLKSIASFFYCLIQSEKRLEENKL